MLQFTDWYLTCARCDEVFLFAAGAQAFRSSRGFATQPDRCPACRSAPRLSPLSPPSLTAGQTSPVAPGLAAP